MLRLHLGEVAIEAKSHLVGLDGPVQGAEVRSAGVASRVGKRVGCGRVGKECMVWEETKEGGAGGVKRAVEGV